MKKPKILLSGYQKFQNYSAAVEAVGGVVEGEYLPRYDESYDGLILCGGGDIDPGYYAEEINGSANINRQRDEAELALMKAFIQAGKPILGICRGCQLINVYFGGSLHQDLETTKIHRSGTAEDLVHTVQTEPGSLLNTLYGTEFAVNSFHHQGAKKPGKGLKITAVSVSDGVIEAMEHESLPVLAVQFHPERMCCSHKRADTVDGTKIFEYFLGLCKK